MSARFPSTSAQNQFLELMQSGGELPKLFLRFVAKMEVLTDHQVGMVDFDHWGALICLVEDSPFSVIFNEEQQKIFLQRCDEGDEIFLDVNQWDFDEDATEEIVDYINDQILTGETYEI